MRLLLDTHALYWAVYFPERLPGDTRLDIEDAETEVFASAVSAYEMANKFRLGKWPEVAALVRGFEAVLASQRFGLLPLNAAHAIQAGLFPVEHRDPFDRMLAAQAEVERLTLVSSDPRMKAFGVSVVW